jgi:hypothetical protein
MNTALRAFLKPETIRRLEDLAYTNRPTRAYLALLRICALILQRAQSLEDASPDQVDQVCTETTQEINDAIPDSFQGVYSILEDISGYTTDDYFTRREHVTSAGKTPLLLRLGQLVAR